VRFFTPNTVKSNLVSARDFPKENQIAPDSIEKDTGRLLSLHTTVFAVQTCIRLSAIQAHCLSVFFWELFEQSRRHTPYTVGSKGQFSYVHPHFERQAARCQRTRSFKLGSRCILRNGPRLSGLRKAFCLMRSSYHSYRLL